MTRLGFRQLPALVLILCTASPASAETVVYEHDSRPLLSITYPDTWVVDVDFEQEAREAGTWADGEPALRVVEATPSDGRHVFVGLWVVPDVTTLDDGLAYTASLSGFLFTDVEAADAESTTLGGMPARVVKGTARRERAPVEFKLALVEPRAGVIAVALYVGEMDAWKLHEEELVEIAASLRPAHDGS